MLRKPVVLSLELYALVKMVKRLGKVAEERTRPPIEDGQVRGLNFVRLAGAV